MAEYKYSFIMAVFLDNILPSLKSTLKVDNHRQSFWSRSERLVNVKGTRSQRSCILSKLCSHLAWSYTLTPLWLVVLHSFPRPSFLSFIYFNCISICWLSFIPSFNFQVRDLISNIEFKVLFSKISFWEAVQFVPK